MKIDLGRKGPLGMDVTITDGVLYLGGTNHILEWIHHFLPFSGWRERAWARDVAHLIADPETPEIHTVAGHSLGGTVACLVWRIVHMTQILTIRTYGAKRPPRGEYPGKHYCIKGDIVPYLPPWRPRLRLTILNYGDLPMSEAHSPSMYAEQMRKDGVKK